MSRAHGPMNSIMNRRHEFTVQLEEPGLADSGIPKASGLLPRQGIAIPRCMQVLHSSDPTLQSGHQTLWRLLSVQPTALDLSILNASIASQYLNRQLLAKHFTWQESQQRIRSPSSLTGRSGLPAHVLAGDAESDD